MLRGAAAWTSILLCLPGLAHADDRFSAVGSLDLRWVHSDADTSFLYGGLGKLRFDAEHDGLRLGRAMLASKWRLADTLSVRAVLDGYGDYPGNPLDVSELYLEYRPYPTGSVRWQARLGAFHMPVSLENRAIGWAPVYSLTPSALNTWLGEELRTLGVEEEARWLGASRGYNGSLALVAAAYGWNDPAGVLIAERGFAMTDRPAGLFGNLGRPGINFFHEIDRKPGYYAGVAWRHHDRLEVRALRYDNRGDPGAATGAGEGAWRTTFSSFGARVDAADHLTFVAQYLTGATAIGPDAAGPDQFNMNFHAGFVLANLAYGRHALTARYDDFGTHQESGFYGPPVNDAGHAWTLAWLFDLSDGWRVAAEWLRLSGRFPPRLEVGEAVGRTDTQVEIALRYRFTFER